MGSPILDMFDSPDIMNAVLGINPGGAMGAMQPGAPQPGMGGGPMGGAPQMPPPPPSAGMGGGPYASLAAGWPAGAGDANANPPPPGPPGGSNGAWSGPPPAPPPAITGGESLSPGQAGAIAPPGPPGGASAAPGPAPLAPGGWTVGPVGGGGPQGGAPIPTSVGPAQPGHDGGPFGGAPFTPVPSGPLGGQPVGRPPAGAYDDKPPLTHLGSLAEALGLTPRQRLGNAITAGMAGLGKGLTAVGNLHPGASGASAFAAGAGGSLTGGVEEVDRQQKQQMAQRKQFFDETIASNNEWLKNKTFPFNIAHLMASTNYLNGNGRNGSGHSAAWQQSDIGRMHLAQQDAANQYARELQTYKELREAGVEVPQKELNRLKTRQQEILDEKYKFYKVDPKTAQGTQQNPIDASKMSKDQMDAMPHGTVFSYKDKNGQTVVTSRDWNTRPGPSGQQQTPDYAATQAALGGGGMTSYPAQQ